MLLSNMCCAVQRGRTLTDVSSYICDDNKNPEISNLMKIDRAFAKLSLRIPLMVVSVCKSWNTFSNVSLVWYNFANTTWPTMTNYQEDTSQVYNGHCLFPVIFFCKFTKPNKNGSELLTRPDFNPLAGQCGQDLVCFLITITTHY